MHLAAGELGPLAAWRLRRRIARDPALAHEWREIHSLWRDMKSLQTVNARPRWASRAGSAADSDRPARSSKGMSMILTPRSAIAACSIVSLAVGGTVVASHYNLFSSSRLLHRDNFQVVLRTPGQLRLYDIDHRFLAEFTKTSEIAPSTIPPERGVVADVYVEDYQATVEGRGMQTVKDANGNPLGYAELTPYSLAIQAAENAQPAPTTPVVPAAKAPAASATPKPWNGSLPESMVINGWNTAHGLLNDANGYYGWQFTGVGKIRFRLASGKVIDQATALPYDETLRAQLKRKLTYSEFSSRVGDGNRDNPGVPIFNITIADKTYEMSGYTYEKFTLPSGMVLIVDIVPLGKS